MVKEPCNKRELPAVKKIGQWRESDPVYYKKERREKKGEKPEKNKSKKEKKKNDK